MDATPAAGDTPVVAFGTSVDECTLVTVPPPMVVVDAVGLGVLRETLKE